MAKKAAKTAGASGGATATASAALASVKEAPIKAAPIKKTEGPRAKKHVKAQVVETPVVESPAGAPTPVAVKAVAHEEISRLAYQFYMERGGREGSPAEDWARAERMLLAGV